MNIKILLAATLAAGTLTIASHAYAKDAEPVGVDTAAETKTETDGSEKTFGDLLKKVLRAGSDRQGVQTAKASAETKAKAVNVDRMTTSSVRAPSKAKSSSKEKSSAKSGSRPYHSIVSRYASQYGVPVSLAHAVISVESNYRASARGRAGEIGLMQIKPSTARGMGYSGSAKGLYDPETNIRYGMKYLAKAYQLGGGSTCGAILRYNAGHGAKRMNRISSAYCAKVKRILTRG
ncbi:lytic transglycosylase domain-containing protein [Nitratireductor luteus]|uniref:lytic transglycosylase domain-containing protein n=1 Tax=Nitratireductor luteus TaxID=2976980 RepID=UPI00223FC0DE|nr:lytic transglycosylase domain-containing protein [Nitratireductor luteus]